MVVDPVKNEVVAKAYDLRQSGYPLQHAVMVAIDLVAHSQGGGMWHLLVKGIFRSHKIFKILKKKLDSLFVNKQ